MSNNTDYVIFPCDLKNSDYECQFFKNLVGCRGICISNGKLCKYCNPKEMSKLEVEEEDD